MKQTPFPTLPTPHLQCPEISTEPAEGAESGKDRCSVWRPLHLDPQLRRRHLVSRSYPTRSPLRPPRRAGVSLAGLRARRRLPQGPARAPGPRDRASDRRLQGWLPRRSRSGCFPASPSWIPYCWRGGAGGGRGRRAGGPPRSDAPLGAVCREGAELEGRRRTPTGGPGWRRWGAVRRREFGDVREDVERAGEDCDRRPWQSVQPAAWLLRSSFESPLDWELRSIRLLLVPPPPAPISRPSASARLPHDSFWSSSGKIKPTSLLHCFCTA